MNQWNGGDIVSDEDYRSVMLMYRLIERIERLERLEYPCRPPKPPLSPSLQTMGVDGHEVINEQAIEFNRVGIPKPKKKKRFLFW